KVKEFFVNKGYMDVIVDIKKEKDEKIENSIILLIELQKKIKYASKTLILPGTSLLRPGNCVEPSKKPNADAGGTLLIPASLTKIIMKKIKKHF
ncbi:MAG: hypothetical protein K8R85_04375, partial [Bacteroidetes bacterium]|nr:hypothetical protein [Bacteroidota bacterium]